MTLRVLVAALSLSFMACCSSHSTVIREEAPYRTEIDFMEQAALQPTAYLEAIVTSSCVCAEEKFVDEQCAKAAKLAQTIKVRVPWHKAMMLWNAGLLTERPSETPPVVPAPELLCRKPVVPTPLGTN